MAKLFIQDIPTREQLDLTFKDRHGLKDTWPLYTNFLFMKVATELENALDAMLAPHNLSSGRFTLLLLLQGFDEGMMPSEMSAKVGVTQATISGLLNGLEKAGHIKRESHEKDGRSYVIKITEQGANLVNTLFPAWIPTIEKFWNQVADDHRSALDQILLKMVHSTKILSEP